MKIQLLSVLFLLCCSSYAQDITGNWYGSSKVGITSLRLVFEIQQEENEFQGTMTSIDQSAQKILWSRFIVRYWH